MWTTTNQDKLKKNLLRPFHQWIETKYRLLKSRRNLDLQHRRVGPRKTAKWTKWWAGSRQNKAGKQTNGSTFGIDGAISSRKSTECINL